MLRGAAVAFIVSVAIHGADHLYRGIGDLRPGVLLAGTIQGFAGVLVVWLVFRGHPAAPVAAVAIGFTSAVLFAAAHLLPEWGVLSDSYVEAAPGAGVTAFSWITAVLEIGADLLFGGAGLNALSSARAAAPKTA